jgi:hypothetical protein
MDCFESNLLVQHATINEYVNSPIESKALTEIAGKTENDTNDEVENSHPSGTESHNFSVGSLCNEDGKFMDCADYVGNCFVQLLYNVPEKLLYYIGAFCKTSLIVLLSVTFNCSDSSVEIDCSIQLNTFNKRLMLLLNLAILQSFLWTFQ